MRPITQSDIEALVADPNSRKLCSRDGRNVHYIGKLPCGEKAVFWYEEHLVTRWLNGALLKDNTDPRDILIATPTWPTLGDNMSDQEKIILLRKVLQDIINGCIHPDKAIRRVIVELKPIREALTKTSLS